jgi:ribulose-5-phosphate 4-epimerase/fuculose-1-phosphate aldolase
LNRGAFVIHSEIHKRRPDVVSAAHAHTIHGRSLAARGDVLRPYVQEACAFYQDQSVYAEYHGLALDLDEGERMAQALGDNRAVIMKHHGVITVGASVDEAAYWFLSFDRCAQIQASVEAVGPTEPMPHAEAVIAHQQFGKPSMAYAGFQVYWDSLAADRDDFTQE